MSFIQTHTGKKFNFLDPHPDDISIEDIAHALSLLCRYNGHTRDFYSVAEHSVRMSRDIIYDCNLKMAALLHDATEAYISDAPRPIKKHMKIGEKTFEEREHEILSIIFKKYLVEENEDIWAKIKYMDNIMLATEKRDLLVYDLEWLTSLPDPMENKIKPWSSKKAEKEFIKEFNRLTKAMGKNACLI